MTRGGRSAIGGVAMWAMPFIGMQAYILRIPACYDVASTVPSLFIAVAARGAERFPVSAKNRCSKIIDHRDGYRFGASRYALYRHGCGNHGTSSRGRRRHHLEQPDPGISHIRIGRHHDGVVDCGQPVQIGIRTGLVA